MKKFLMFGLIALGSMIGFTSCGDDEDDSGKEGEISAKIEDKGNQLILKAVQKGVGTLEVTCDFKDNVCTKAVYKITYLKEEWAKEDYEEWLEMIEEEEEYEGCKASLKGKTVTVDMTALFKGMSKDEVRMVLEEEKAAFEEDADYEYDELYAPKKAFKKAI